MDLGDGTEVQKRLDHHKIKLTMNYRYTDKYRNPLFALQLAVIFRNWLFGRRNLSIPI